jgi:site-specific recombinase XerD
MKTLWEAAAKARQGYHRSLWLAALGLLYGTGLRRGELERLTAKTLRHSYATHLMDRKVDRAVNAWAQPRFSGKSASEGSCDQACRRLP